MDISFHINDATITLGAEEVEEFKVILKQLQEQNIALNAHMMRLESYIGSDRMTGGKA